MDIWQSRDNIEYKKAWQEYQRKMEHVVKIRNLENRLTSGLGRDIIKEGWDESLHPRDENGRFTNGGGGGSSSGDTGEGASSSGQGRGTQKPSRPAVVADNNEVNSNEFVTMLDEAKATCDPRTAWRVDTDRKAADFDVENIKMYSTPGGSTFAIKPDGDIISVCKNHAGDENLNAKDIMAAAVERGGTHLDSYSGNYGFYAKCGFEAVSRCKFDEQYAPPGWTKGKDDHEDIYFMRYVGVGNVQDKDETSMLARVPYSTDYDAATKVLEDVMRGE